MSGGFPDNLEKKIGTHQQISTNVFSVFESNKPFVCTEKVLNLLLHPVKNGSKHSNHMLSAVMASLSSAFLFTKNVRQMGSHI